MRRADDAATGTASPRQVVAKPVAAWADTEPFVPGDPE
jgi:hypothetical protein